MSRIFRLDILKTFLKIILLALVFTAGYALAHESVSIPLLDRAISKATNFCGDKKIEGTISGSPARP